LEASEIEERIMAERRPQAMPPSPRNPALEWTEPLMYTGETRGEFYSRRQALEGLWNGFMANIANRQPIFGNETA